MKNLMAMLGVKEATEWEIRIDCFYWELRNDIEDMNETTMTNVRLSLVRAINNKIFDRYDVKDLVHRFNQIKNEIVRF